MENLTLNDFRSAMRYFAFTRLMPNYYGTEWKLENLYMESQGNLSAVHKSMAKFKDRPY